MRRDSDRPAAFGLASLHSNICICSTLVVSFICLTNISPALGDGRIRDFAERFRSTSGEELYEMWHTDCHRRCRDDVLDHVNLGCSFDPYKIVNKRSVNSTETRPHVNQLTESKSSIFITRHASASFLATAHKKKKVGHQIIKRGIFQECCSTKPCSWEEYAEYCYTHNRRSTDRSSQCYK